MEPSRGSTRLDIPPTNRSNTFFERSRTLDSAAFDATVEGSPLSTVEPPRRFADSAARGAVAALRPMSNTSPGASPAIAIERTLGQGGMGVVHLATQVALGRQVAVKALKSTRTSEDDRLRLLQEAWVTGVLEHPNIVPIHDIGLDESGSPLIVMKRIEGRAWLDLLRDQAALKELIGESDPLEWSLRVLIQVANAVHFAHSRGFVHRDLKPENVMIGAFGEVYVVDWGIAVSLTEDGEGRFPLAEDAVSVAGTPCYMAPEMLGGEPPMISSRTDVYLLGATLFHVVTGEPPHTGGTFGAIVQQILASPPKMPAAMPADLGAICMRAMQLDPAERYESALELRVAIEGYLEHRGSARLASEAETSTSKLVQAIAHPTGDPAAHRTRVYQLFGAARFGFQEALRAWPENAMAREGLTRAAVTMIDYELAGGDPRAAMALLAEVDAPDPALRKRVDEALEEKALEEKQRETFARIGRELDPSLGRGGRTAVVAILGVIWALTPFLRAMVWGTGGEPYPIQLGWTAAFLVLFAGLASYLRTSLGRSALNRRIGASIGFALAAQLVLALGGWIGGIGPAVVQVATLFLYFSVSAMVVITLEKRLLATALGHLFGFLIVAAFPHAYYYALSIGNVVMAINAVVIWREERTAR